MANSVYPPASRELSQKRRALAPDIEAAFDAFSQRVFADGALPAKTKQVIAVAVAHVTQCRTASKGIPRRRCATVQRQRSSGKQFGSPPRCGLEVPTLIRPFRSWQWTRLLTAPRAADSRRLRPPTEGHDDIGNKAAFTRAVETGLCAAISRRWCPRPRRSPLATRPTQVGGGHRSVD